MTVDLYDRSTWPTLKQKRQRLHDRLFDEYETLTPEQERSIEWELKVIDWLLHRGEIYECPF